MRRLALLGAVFEAIGWLVLASSPRLLAVEAQLLARAERAAAACHVSGLPSEVGTILRGRAP